jgi:hypothetical protein
MYDRYANNVVSPLWKTIALTVYMVQWFAVCFLYVMGGVAFMTLFTLSLRWHDGQHHSFLQHLNFVSVAYLVLLSIVPTVFTMRKAFAPFMQKVAIPMFQRLLTWFVGDSLPAPSILSLDVTLAAFVRASGKAPSPAPPTVVSSSPVSLHRSFYYGCIQRFSDN